MSVIAETLLTYVNYGTDGVIVHQLARQGRLQPWRAAAVLILGCGVVARRPGLGGDARQRPCVGPAAEARLHALPVRAQCGGSRQPGGCRL